ncbi:MAG: HIRAN domain-containing protein [Clostridia bacterium]|nr:HIRAN domain-containing protein [Clostridia bacterium]
MSKIYFTITGTCYRHGQEFFEPDMTVRLVKEPDNKFDKEAIKVEMEGLGLVGYVANSPHTVLGESFSAGRIYDKIGDTATGEVLYVLPKGVLCRIDEDSLLPTGILCADNDEDKIPF